MYESDEHGILDLKLTPGKHMLVARAHLPNATVIELDVPAKGLREKVLLNRQPVGHPAKSGYPDLSVNVVLRDGNRPTDELVVLTISSNKDEPYTLHQNDLRFTSGRLRVLPPKSQQHAGLVIPPHGQGEREITLRWDDYVRNGIWMWRNEEMDDIWPMATPPRGRVWFRVKVGITGALPTAMYMPEVMLNPRLLKAYKGALRGRFVFAGERPKPTRIDSDGRQGKLPIDHVLVENEVFDESLVIGADGGIANVVVWLRSPNAPTSLPEHPCANLRMEGGRYEPHILLLQKSQDLDGGPRLLLASGETIVEIVNGVSADERYPPTTSTETTVN